MPSEYDALLAPEQPKTSPYDALLDAAPAAPPALSEYDALVAAAPSPPTSVSDLMSAPAGTTVHIPKNVRVPTMSEVGVVPKEAIEGALRYTTPIGLATDVAETVAPNAIPTKIGRGIVSGASEAISAFTTPESLSQLAIMPASKIGQILVNLGFGAHAVANIPEQIKAFGATDDPTEKARIITGITASLALPAVGLAHGILRKPPTVTDRLFPETAEPPPEAAVTEKLFPAEKSNLEPQPSNIITPEEVKTNAEQITQAAQPDGLRTEPAVPGKVEEPAAPQSSEGIPESRQGPQVQEIAPSVPGEPIEQAPMAEVIAAEVPKLRPGEKQGDLLSTQPEDLTLVGEKGTDFAARQAESDAAAQAAEEARLKQEHEQGLLSDFQEHQARGGDELLDAIESGGGLPAKSSPRAETLSGELKNIREELVSETGQQKTRGFDYNKIFKKDAPDLDALTQHLRSKGFDVETPNDTLSLIRDRLRSGEPIHGNEARMTAIEEASLGPGAASAKERLATYEQRRFGKRFQADESISPEIREQTGNQFYEPASNVKTVREAEAVIEDYGTDTAVRLVRDEAAPLEPRVRSTIAQGLIKKLNQSHQEAKAAGDLPRAQEFLDQSVDTAEYLSELGTKLGQGVQSFAIWSRLSPEGMLASAKRMAKRSGTELPPEVQQKILDLTDEVHQAPEGFQKDEKTMALLNYMADLKGINPAEIPTALWYSNILSGFTTQLVNTIDTGLNVLSESAAMAASHPTAVPDILAGLYRGMIKGGFEAANVLRTGRSPTGDKVLQQRVLERVQFGKEGVPMDTSTVIGRFMKAAFESKPAAILNLWKYPLRAMVASDTVFYNSFKEARTRVLARALAKKEGLSGAELFQRVDQLLNETPGKKQAAIEQAKSEGLEGVNLARRSREIIEQGRPEELVSSSDEAAAIATYNHEPSGVLGLIAHNVSEITQNFPPAKFVVPFTRIVANVTNRGLDYTPWGYKRLFFGEWGGKKFGSEPPTGEAYRTQLVKATAGTVAMATLGALDAADKIQVTAKGPDDPDERKQLMSAGWRPYSVRVGDAYYSYQYTPLNLGLAMIGHYRDAVRYNKLGEKDVQTRLAYGMLKASSTIFDMSFLSGVSDLVETVQGATSSTKGAGRLLARTASSIVVPNLVKQIDKLFDPTIYQADTIQQALVRETPVARSLTQKPMLNALGEPVKGSQNKFFAFETNDPVWKLITEKQAWIPIPSKTTKIRNRPITPDEYYRLIQESGPHIRSYITRNLDRFRSMPAQKVHEHIRDASIRERDRVKRRFR